MTLQIQWIIARSFRRMRLRVAAVMAQVSAACSITLLTHVEYTRPLVTRGQIAVGEKGEQFMELAPSTFAACYSSQIATTTSREHVPKIAKLWDSLKFFVINLHLFHCSTINMPCRTQASSAPEIRFSS